MSDKSRSAPTNTCPICGASFRCGTAAGDMTCWCSRMPPLLVPQAVQGCLCPNCLKAAIAAQADEPAS